jgi:hypothetical protein
VEERQTSKFPHCLGIIAPHPGRSHGGLDDHLSGGQCVAPELGYPTILGQSAARGAYASVKNPCGSCLASLLLFEALVGNRSGNGSCPHRITRHTLTPRRSAPVGPSSPNLRHSSFLLARVRISFRDAVFLRFYADPAISGMANRDWPNSRPGRSLNRSRSGCWN